MTNSMKVFQIGELTKTLDREYKEYLIKTKNQVPWINIIRMRDRFAHHYGDMDLNIIFKTALEDIPKLSTFIKNELENI